MNATTINENGPSAVPRGISAGQERTALYTLCYHALPNHQKTIPFNSGDEWRGLDVEKIAADIGISKQKVSGWFQQNSLPGQRVAAMIALEGGTLTFEKLGPFIRSR
jgi:hypothetical protein